VHRLMEMKGDMSIISLRPRWPTALRSAYKISRSDEVLTIKDWSKVLRDRSELLGGNMKRSPQMGDRFISILHNGETGVYLFYAILPSRE
jgi:hypothetical protein